MAIVYKAEQPSLNRFVALKILLPSFTGEDASVGRLQREAQAAAGLDHANIVSIFEVGEYDGLHYIAMKFVEGQPLDALLQEQKMLPPDRVVKILAQVASALDYAHRRNLVHRDIKPSNILIGADDRVTLTDFGLVKATGTATLTNSGALVGTPAYMSPEQARGVETDYRADIYSLGVVCYEMLAGRPPFEGNPLSIILAHASQMPPSLRSFRAGISPAAEAVVLRALTKEPQDRYATAGEFIAMLRQALTRPADDFAAPISTTASAVAPRPALAPTPTPHRPMGWVVGTAATAVVVVASLGALWGTGAIDPPRLFGRTPSTVPAVTAAIIAPAATSSATPLPATLTPTPRPPSPTPSATLLPPMATFTAAPTASATASATFQPTATLAPAPTDTVAPAPTATARPPTTTPATLAPTVATLQLLGPADGQAFRASEVPLLVWSRSVPLAGDEQFVVVIDRVPPPPNTGVWHDYHITRATSLSAPDYLAQTTADGKFQWYVQVMRSPRVDGGILAGESVGASSARRSFSWEAVPTPAPGDGQPGPRPTPTRGF